MNYCGGILKDCQISHLEDTNWAFFYFCTVILSKIIIKIDIFLEYDQERLTN